VLSSVDPPHGAACPRLHRFLSVAVLLTSLLTLTAVWFSCIHTASHYELMTGVSIFRSRDLAVAAVVALVSFLLAALLLEIFHRSNGKVCLSSHAGVDNMISCVCDFVCVCVSVCHKTDGLVNTGDGPSTSDKNLASFGPVMPEITRLYCVQMPSTISRVCFTIIRQREARDKITHPCIFYGQL